MTIGGWIMLVVSWGIILVVVIFCFATMFKVERKRK